MVYVIIAITMLFILGPILTLRPSPKERRQARIRQQAMVHGVNIQPISLLQRSKKFNALLQRNPHIGEYQWYRYQLIAAEDQTGPSVKGEWVQRKTREGLFVWESPDVRQQVPEPVAQLIEQWQSQQKQEFLVLELGPRNAAIIWNEQGDVAEVDELITCLRALLLC